jgi:DNA-binding transcriptional LysR family regulator
MVAGTYLWHSAPAMTNGWLGVEIRHLVALSAVAREGSFRGAADELGYVQSAVSQQISQLERLIGCRLLERSRGMRGCSPTRAGEVLLSHVDEIVARYRAAQADMAAMEQDKDAPLRVGILGSVATRLLPEVICRLDKLAPGKQVEFIEGRTEAELSALVEHAELDGAFGLMPLDRGLFEIRELWCEPVVLVVQADSPLARASEPPSIQELARLPLIGLRTEPAETSVEAWLRAFGLSPRVVRAADSDAMAQALVAAGLGVALLPRSAVNEHDQRTATVGLGEQAPVRRLALYWHRQRHTVDGLRELSVAASLAAQELAERADAQPMGASRIALAGVA